MCCNKALSRPFSRKLSTKSMNITTFEYPYKHIVVDGIIPSEMSYRVYDHCSDIEESTIDYTRDGEPDNSVEMSKNSIDQQPLLLETVTYITDKIDTVSRLFTGIYDEAYGKWTIEANEVNRNHGNFLTPHTDDPVEMLSKGYNPPLLRCLLYVACPKTNYSHYGTKIYVDGDRSSYVKEVEFVASRLLIFECSDKSWHGTDFIHGLPHRRMFINGLYQKTALGYGEEGIKRYWKRKNGDGS